jgi:hypothetical protein
MSRRKPLVEPRLWQAALAVGLIAAGSSPGCGRTSPPPALNRSYLNEEHGFSVLYPDTLDFREYSAENAAIGYAAGDGFDVRVEVSVETGTASSFDAFVDEHARLACAADAPGVSLRCPSVERQDDIRSLGRIRGDVLYLRHERSTAPGGPPVEVGRRGPFVAFDITADEAPEDEFRVLFVRAPVSLEPYLNDAALVLDVARTVRLTDD